MSNNNEFKPYIPADRVIPELTLPSVFIGILLAVIFGGANAYLGLRVGMTVSASIPAAVLSMGIIRFVLKRDSILENNIVQTIGSAGESLAAGAIFTMPTLFMWAQEGLTETPGLLEIALIALCGGVLGVLFMVPLRNALIVQEHGVLPYPEGVACAEVLLAGEKGGSSAKTVFSGLGIAAVYKFIADGLKLFPSEVDWSIKAYKGSGIGMDVLPALAGVGYICGLKVSSYLFAGGTVAWFVIMPLLSTFGGAEIAALDTWGLWSSYIRYIGAGAVATGGIISLVKSLPTIVKTFASAVKLIGSKTGEENRTNRDLPMLFVLTGILACAVAIWLIPAIPVNIFGALIIVIFGFFFATVSSRMVGVVGSSNNPVSGMAIATLLLSSILLKATGTSGAAGMVAAISIGSVICIIAAIAGDTSQDLKTGYIIGSTPMKQQIAELIGAIVASVAIGAILYLFNTAWEFGSTEVPAAQATLMKMVVEGVFGGDLPWNLVFVGVALAVVMEVLAIPVLPFAVGLYLPIHLSSPMLVGGLIRYYVEKRKSKKFSNEERETQINKGILFSSGMIAGEGLIGIALAVLAVIPYKSGTIADLVNISGKISLGNPGGLAFFAVLCGIFLLTVTGKKKAD